jgi:hypothetical protein
MEHEMKKIGILLAILLVAGVCAMADEAVPAQDDLLFADVDAVALSQVEMEAVDGGMGAKEAVVWVAVTVCGGIVYDNVNDSVEKTTGKKINEHYQDSINRVVKSVKKALITTSLIITLQDQEQERGQEEYERMGRLLQWSTHPNQEVCKQ